MAARKKAASNKDAEQKELLEGYDPEEVEAALARETFDGSGFESEDELPPSDLEEGEQ
jgi:hypothetical protein